MTYYYAKDTRNRGNVLILNPWIFLVDIGFFSEYGNVDTIKRTRYWYDKFAKRKTIKKEKIDCDDWLIEIHRKNAEKETDKQFSGIKNNYSMT